MLKLNDTNTEYRHRHKHKGMATQDTLILLLLQKLSYQTPSTMTFNTCFPHRAPPKSPQVSAEEVV